MTLDGTCNGDTCAIIDHNFTFKRQAVISLQQGSMTPKSNTEQASSTKESVAFEQTQYRKLLQNKVVISQCKSVIFTPRKPSNGIWGTPSMNPFPQQVPVC